MTEEVVKVENYIFSEFQIFDRNPSSLRFKATHDSGIDAGEDDVGKVTMILQDLGK